VSAGRLYGNLRDILEWAEDHRQRIGERPKQSDGKIYGAPMFAGPPLTWRVIDNALRRGHHGLPDPIRNSFKQ
jgi:hypothetical protein